MTIVTETTQAVAGTILGETTMVYISGENASSIFYITKTETHIESVPFFVSKSDLQDMFFDDAESVFSYLVHP